MTPKASWWTPFSGRKKSPGDLAQESGLAVLTDTHWQVIRFFREYYLQNGRAPLNRQLKSGIGNESDGD